MGPLLHNVKLQQHKQLAGSTGSGRQGSENSQPSPPGFSMAARSSKTFRLNARIGGDSREFPIWHGDCSERSAAGKGNDVALVRFSAEGSMHMLIPVCGTTPGSHKVVLRPANLGKRGQYSGAIPGFALEHTSVCADECDMSNLAVVDGLLQVV